MALAGKSSALRSVLSYCVGVQVEKPRREDVECLAKLMATVGSHLDRHARGREFMDAYFLRINTLKESKSLPESRLRFLLQVRRDIIPKIAGH